MPPVEHQEECPFYDSNRNENFYYLKDAVRLKNLRIALPCYEIGKASERPKDKAVVWLVNLIKNTLH